MSSRDGFTLPPEDVEAAIGRGVARALGLPTETRRAPVQGETHDAQGRYAPRPAGTIAWPEHLEAYEAYARRYGRSQSAERIAERAGFGFYELVDLLGREPTTWEPCPGTGERM